MSAPATSTCRAAGERFFATVLGERLSDQDLDGPSLLPGWTRRTVVAHVARNADALVNLLTWARTRMETPIFASSEARDAAIAETSTLPVDDLLSDCLSAAKRLDTAVQTMPEKAWSVQVKTAQGRTVPAAQVLWMRSREVWVHAVDLQAGATFADVPPEILRLLVADIVTTWRRRGTEPQARFVSGLNRLQKGG